MTKKLEQFEVRIRQLTGAAYREPEPGLREGRRECVGGLVSGSRRCFVRDTYACTRELAWPDLRAGCTPDITGTPVAIPGRRA